MQRGDSDEAVAAIAPQLEDEDVLSRKHTWPQCYFIVCSLAMCITVDILQYSMPLAFLPSVLEDRGHSPLKIATAIGVYYYTGFVGQICITSYQIYCMIYGRGRHEDVRTVSSTRRQIVWLIICLLIGAGTLALQAMSPRIMVHTVCRFVQGFAGAFIFFYAFLLCATMFEDLGQRDFAMTAASAALNVAEVLGSSLGATLFDNFGQRAVFWFLGIVSMLNQVLLIAVLFFLKVDPDPVPRDRRVSDGGRPVNTKEGWKRLGQMLRSPRLGVAVALIMMAAVVKGSVEECLPFHADHRWGMKPIEIGNLFLVIAASFLLAASTMAKPCPWPLWQMLGIRWRVLFCAFFLVMLGLTAWSVFLVATYMKRWWILISALAAYGACVGLTFTPAALLLADDIEHQDGKAKEAVNGIWNTMWEAGGSIGFFLGGFLAEDYDGQINLMGAYFLCCLITAGLLVGLNTIPRPDRKLSIDYGGGVPNYGGAI
jgi:MFS family permease